MTGRSFWLINKRTRKLITQKIKYKKYLMDTLIPKHFPFVKNFPTPSRFVCNKPFIEGRQLRDMIEAQCGTYIISIITSMTIENRAL